MKESSLTDDKDVKVDKVFHMVTLLRLLKLKCVPSHAVSQKKLEVSISASQRVIAFISIKKGD